jgi:hypothetical protein
MYWIVLHRPVELAAFTAHVSIRQFPMSGNTTQRDKLQDGVAQPSLQTRKSDCHTSGARVLGQPRGPANWRGCLLHGANLHVADNIWQHFDEAEQNDKRHQAENHYCHHGSPRNSLVASLSKTERCEYAHTDEP